MTLGILGGMGPASGAWFYSRLIALTDARCDADHIDVLLSGRASTPDRSAYLLGESPESPLPVLLADAHRLERAGAELLVLLCNTAHAFLPELRAAVRIPVLDMPSMTVFTVAARGFRRPGLLATRGCYAAGVYARAAARCGISMVYPPPVWRERLQKTIYDRIKSGADPDAGALSGAAAALAATGCDCLILGCTELSCAWPTGAREHAPEPGDGALPFFDPVEILCRRTVLLCGKTIKEGSPDATFFFARRPAGRALAGV